MRGQISLEFSILFLSLLIVVIITTITPGLYGYKKTIETSHASLGHGALSKLKTNIEMISVLDPGSRKVVYIKSPPGVWKVEGNSITLEGNGFTISTNCDINLRSNVREYRTNLSVIEIYLIKINDDTINIRWD
ncbi:MAG TPA: class III signal peptide-containing protein [Candidatus Nanopusillus sp.]|nr:class III signal peptide-containing protein [Candidatus Nanopusillus sp.]